MSRTRTLSALLALGAVLTIGATAQAQTVTGYAINRFDPSERGSRWFTVESLDYSGKVAPAFGVLPDFGYLPIQLHDVNNDYKAVVETQLAFHVGASLTMFDRLRLGVTLPIYAEQSGTTIQRYDGRYIGASEAAVGDLRIGLDGRIWGEPNGPFRIGAGLRVWAPTGYATKYTGDGDFSMGGTINVAGDIGMFAYAARGGYIYRNRKQTFGPTPVGDELPFGIAAGIKLLDDKLLLGPEIQGSIAVNNTGEIFSKNIVPAYMLIGAHYKVAGFNFGLGAGPGLSTASGTPALRVVGAVEWALEPTKEKPKPSDRDGDGIIDDDDACPDVKGVATNDKKTNGCPPPAPPPPPPDRDGDGIPDAQDACPDVKGVATNDPKTNGCPPDPDRDKDGIKNEDDACPDTSGPANADPKKNGCPMAFVQAGQIVILEQVKFKTASAQILPGKDSEEVLQAVLKVLTDHKEIAKVRVEGHTDNQGAAAYNKTLSGQRAESVMKWLVAHKVDKARLSAKGFGQEKPIADNKTEEGRRQNRRVEFHIE